MKYDSVFYPGVRVKHSLLQTFAINSIDVYQKQISATLPARCPYFPTCSNYAKEAIKKYGLIQGSYLAAARLWRCRPGMGGFDPVPRDEEEVIISLTTWRIRLRSERLPISLYFKNHRKGINCARARTFHLVLSFPNVLDYNNILPKKNVEIMTEINSQRSEYFKILDLDEIRSRRHYQRLFRVIGEVQLPYLQSKALFEKELLESCSTLLIGEGTKGTIFFASYGLPKRNILPHSEVCTLGNCCLLAVI